MMAKIELYNSSELKTCFICGDDLHKLDAPKEIHCDFCGRTKTSSMNCDSGHYICDSCIETPITEHVKQKCLSYKGDSPIELAVMIMDSPIIKMHGPEHHFIVPAVLLTCIANKTGKQDELSEKLEIAERRAKAETPNVCNYSIGTCGAAIGTGVFLSIFMDRENQHEDAWSITNLIVAESLKLVAESDGPRCCKRDTYISLEAAIGFLHDRFAVDLPISQARCTFSMRNRTCQHEECTYYNIGFSLV
jgi:hypothetical protein